MIHLHDAILLIFLLLLFFFKAPPTTEIYTLSLHDALPIYWIVPEQRGVQLDFTGYAGIEFAVDGHRAIGQVGALWKRLYDEASDRKSTRLNSSHSSISYAVFCLKKKKKKHNKKNYRYLYDTFT